MHVEKGSLLSGFDQKAKLTKVCSVCQTAARSICSNCRSEYYCSRECQTKDWKLHKQHCNGLKEARSKDKDEFNPAIIFAHNGSKIDIKGVRNIKDHNTPVGDSWKDELEKIYGKASKLKSPKHFDEATTAEKAAGGYLTTGAEYDILRVSCSLIDPRFNEYLIETTQKTVDARFDYISKYSKIQVKSCYKLALEKLTQYDDATLNRHYEGQTEDWQNWCDDVVFFYCLRVVLFKKPIPIVAFPPPINFHT